MRMFSASRNDGNGRMGSMKWVDSSDGSGIFKGARSIMLADSSIIRLNGAVSSMPPVCVLTALYTMASSSRMLPGNG